MQTNNKVVKGYRGAKGLLSMILLAIVGLLFTAFGIYLLVQPLEEGENHTGGIVCLIAGIIVLVIGILGIIKNIKTLKKIKPLSEEEVKANEEKFAAEGAFSTEVSDIKLSFTRCGKLNQSYIVKDKDGKVYFECKLLKFNPFAASTYEFNDYIGNTKKVMKIGKVLQSSVGEDGFETIISSRFKIDGVMCWDYLRDRGLEVKQFVGGSHFTSFEITKLGEPIAKILPANVKNPFDENNTNIFRMGNGYYRLEIITGKLDEIVMAAFIISQAEVVE